MGDFTNGRFMKTFATIVSLIIIGINLLFVGGTVAGLPSVWWVWLPLVGLGIPYLAFVAYLGLYCCICLGAEGLVEYEFIQNLYRVDDFIEDRKLQKQIRQK